MKSEHCRIVELRRYALRPNARETLIELFDREFVETQEEVGITVLGQFRDLDDRDSFVWLRGFGDMRARKRALEAFYGGPVWRAHREAANATMVDVDNVLLLRRLSGLEHEDHDRPAPGSRAVQPGLLGVTIYPLTESSSHDFREFFVGELEPALREAGIAVRATFATEHSRNTFPALPVRTDDAFVWIALFSDEEDRRRRVTELEQSPLWRGRILPALARQLDGHAEVLRLTPTARSWMHG